jgi:hypothetical protein
VPASHRPEKSAARGFESKMTPILITHRKKTLSLFQWAKTLGVSERNAWNRWNRGVRDFKTLFSSEDLPGHSRQIEHDGKIQSIAAWARECGVSRERMRQRLLKYPVAEALRCGKQR